MNIIQIYTTGNRNSSGKAMCDHLRLREIARHNATPNDLVCSSLHFVLKMVNRYEWSMKRCAMLFYTHTTNIQGEGGEYMEVATC